MKRIFPEKVITSFDGTRIHYLYKKGPKSCVVFIHGLSGQHSAWEPFYTHLHQLGHSVLSIDIRGHGFSDKPKNTKAYTLQNAIKDFEMIVTHEKLNRFILVAHCYGSYLGMSYADKYPDTIIKMLMVSPNYKPAAHVPYKLVVPPYILALQLLGLFYRKDRYEKIDYTAVRGIKDIDIPKVLPLYRAASMKTMIEFTKDIMKYDFTTIAKKIKTPTLIIAGATDIIAPVKLSIELQKIMPNATLRIYEGINHQPTLNAWQRFQKDLTEFVQTGK